MFIESKEKIKVLRFLLDLIKNSIQFFVKVFEIRGKIFTSFLSHLVSIKYSNFLFWFWFELLLTEITIDLRKDIVVHDFERVIAIEKLI